MSDITVDGELIRQVTKRYAKEHELCHVVDEYLGELGLAPVCVTKRVPVRLAIQADVRIKIDQQDWEAKTDEEKVAFLTEKINLSDTAIRVLSNNEAELSVETPFVNVQLAGAILDPDLGENPVGYEPLYVSYEGRVRHYYPINRDGYTYALCGGATGTSRPRTTGASGRNDSRICARCDERAKALNA